MSHITEYLKDTFGNEESLRKQIEELTIAIANNEKISTVLHDNKKNLRDALSLILHDEAKNQGFIKGAKIVWQRRGYLGYKAKIDFLYLDDKCMTMRAVLDPQPKLPMFDALPALNECVLLKNKTAKKK